MGAEAAVFSMNNCFHIAISAIVFATLAVVEAAQQRQGIAIAQKKAGAVKRKDVAYPTTDRSKKYGKFHCYAYAR